MKVLVARSLILGMADENRESKTLPTLKTSDSFDAIPETLENIFNNELLKDMSLHSQEFFSSEIFNPQRSFTFRY